MNTENISETEIIDSLVSAIESGAIIDPRADEKYFDILDHPRVKEALKRTASQ